MTRPLIAILRGIQPNEASQIAMTLVDAGFDKLEVPLNSPDAYDSIGRIVESVGGSAEVGAGTVLTVEQVDELAEIGCQMVISPNCDPKVIDRTKERRMKSYPGVMTPSECFAAHSAGADGLKFFPASLIGIDGFNAFKAVLPVGLKTYAVGGVGPEKFGEWLSVGITGFGIGSSLYKLGVSTIEVSKRATLMVKAYDNHASNNGSEYVTDA